MSEEWKEVKITKADLLGFRSMGHKYDFGLMHLLKQEGAPITGVFLMEPDLDNYEWQWARNDSWGNGQEYMLIRWRKMV